MGGAPDDPAEGRCPNPRRQPDCGLAGVAKVIERTHSLRCGGGLHVFGFMINLLTSHATTRLTARTVLDAELCGPSAVPTGTI